MITFQFKLSYYDISCNTIGAIMKTTKRFEGDFMRIAFFFGVGIILAFVSFFVKEKGTQIYFLGTLFLFAISIMMPPYILIKFCRIFRTDLVLSIGVWAIPPVVCFINLIRQMLQDSKS